MEGDDALAEVRNQLRYLFHGIFFRLCQPLLRLRN